jgi:hypothetical protein
MQSLPIAPGLEITDARVTAVNGVPVPMASESGSYPNAPAGGPVSSPVSGPVARLVSAAGQPAAAAGNSRNPAQVAYITSGDESPCYA